MRTTKVYLLLFRAAKPMRTTKVYLLLFRAAKPMRMTTKVYLLLFPGEHIEPTLHFVCGGMMCYSLCRCGT